MEHLLKNLVKIESKFLNYKNSKNALMLIEIYFLLYFISKDKFYLNKLNVLIDEGLNINKNNIELHLCKTLFFIESNEHKEAKKIIKNLSKYSSFLKNNYVNTYSWYLYVISLQDLKENKNISIKIANKSIKKLIDIGNNLSLFLAGNLSLELDEKTGVLLINKSFNNGFNSIFLMLPILNIENRSVSSLIEDNLLIKFINWSIDRKINIYNFLKKNEIKLNFVLKDNLKILKKIYNIYKENWVIEAICKINIIEKNYSYEANVFYREACQKQIDINNLFVFLIHSSFENNIDEVNGYALNKYIEQNKIEDYIKPYIYHIILISSNMDSLLDNKKSEIFDFAIKCIEKNSIGRYYYSIYKFLIDYNYLESLNSKQIEFIDSILIKNLFKVDLYFNNESTKNLWIVEKDKKNITFIENVKKKVTIDLLSLDFLCIYLNNNTKILKKLKPKTVKNIVNGDFYFYYYFFKKGYIELNLMISLTKIVIYDNNLLIKYIDIVKSTINLKGISKEFQSECMTYLSNYLFLQDKYDLALSYYKEINDSYLGAKSTEQLLKLFVNSKNYESAIKLIYKKLNSISEKTLFVTLQILMEVEKYKKELVEISYRLVINSWFDENLLDSINKYYNGTLDDFYRINESLMKLNYNAFSINKKILENSIFIRKLDSNNQSIFRSMYIEFKHEKIVLDFATYCCYEIIVNNYHINYKTLEIIEEIYFEKNNIILGYGLVYHYIYNSISTKNSKTILINTVSEIEENKFAFPIIKKIEDKSILNSYIYKNQPFWYRGNPKLKIYLYYRRLGEKKYEKIKMKYFKFGIFYCNLVIFYNEEIEYYFSENKDNANIITELFTLQNKDDFIVQNKDDFFQINNALIYQKMFKLKEVDDILMDMIKPLKTINSKLI